jgi:hypothetical protein
MALMVEKAGVFATLGASQSAGLLVDFLPSRN